MRVGCIGNTNNLLFSVTRCLRDAGVDVTLLLQNNELWQFDPSCDSFDFRYRDYTRTLQWGSPQSFQTTPDAQIRDDLAAFDFLIGINTAPAFCAKAGRGLDLFIPHGNDLYKLPSVHMHMRWDQRIRQRPAVQFFATQRRGIGEAWIINHEDAHPRYREIVAELGVQKRNYYFGFPMIYPGIYAPGRIEENYARSAWYPEFKTLRDDNDFLVFNGNQQMWTQPYAPQRTFEAGVGKGTDRLLQGYALFLNKRPRLRTQLIQFEYGPDVEASRKMISELGIADHISWFPTLPRKELMVALSLSDCGIGQFFNGCVGGGTTWEVLVSGKPLLHYRCPDFPLPLKFSGEFPHHNVLEPEEIAEAFATVAHHPDAAREMGLRGLAWYIRNLVDGPVAEIRDMIRIRETGSSMEEWRADRIARFSLAATEFK